MKKIIDILVEIRPEYDFQSSNDFISEGLLDSFDLITLVSELENTYGILIDAMDIVPDNFKNADSIAKLVKKNGGEV